MVASLLELIFTKNFDVFKISMKYLDTLNNQLKNSKRKISMRLLEFEFKSDKIIKSKAINYIVKKILVSYK